MDYNRKTILAQYINPNSPLVDSSVAIIKHDDNDNVIDSKIISSPLYCGEDINKDQIKSRLEELLYRSLNFSSKLIGVDELTGERHNEDSLKLYIIDGVGSINKHHCAGNIIYHPNNSHMLKWLDLIFWNEYIVFSHHNLFGKLNIERSNGKIDTEAFIPEKTSTKLESRSADCIRWSKQFNDFIIRVKVDNGDQQKHVTLTHIYKHNPNINLTISIYRREYYKGSPEWVFKLYDSWLTALNKIRILSGRNISINKTLFSSFNLDNDGLIIGVNGDISEEIKVGDKILAINGNPYNWIAHADALNSIISEEVNIVVDDKKINIKLI